MIRQLLCFFLLFSINVFAQNQGDLSGRVIDGETGIGLEGATIQIENSDFYTISDQNGYFQITDIPTSSFNVTASFIGFKSLTKFNVIIKSAGNQSLQYVLNPTSELLDETIDRFNINKDECLIFEDSLEGVLAAKNSGVKVIGITSSSSNKVLKDAGCVMSISDYLDFKLSDIRM